MNSLKTICLLVCLASLTLAYDVPPSIVVQPQPVDGDERLPVILTCQAEGRPEPTYYWEKNGVLVDVENNPSASLDRGNLVINPLTKEDNGQYQCFANNRLGTAISKKVNVLIAFMEHFEDTIPTVLTVRHGEPLRLHCGAQFGPPRGYPSSYIYWTDAAPKPTPITYNARLNQDQDGNLVFSNVNASDAKGYYCQAINNVVGTSDRSQKITVQVLTDLPPVMTGASVVARAANKVAIRTETFKLKCMAIGYPTPTITWKRGEEQLESGERVSIDEYGQELVISAVKNSDKGSYTCNAENSLGTDEFTTVVSVESAPYFPAAPSDETKEPGESVSIECRADGVPPPTVDWLVNGQPWADFQSKIDTARWTVVTGQSNVATIDITNLQTTDSNVLQCIATNKYSEEITSVIVNIVSIPARIPTFTPQTRRLSVLREDSATFVCHVEGKPSPTITWKFEGSVLINGPKYSIDDAEGRLVITHTVEGDSGDYECTAINAIDGIDYTETETGTLTVLGKTTIDIPPVDLMIKEGQTASFQCEITYDQELDKPEVYWMKGDQRLTANQDNSLIMDYTVFRDSGTYTCVVETTIDANAGTVHTVNASAQLTVKGHPDPPQNLVLRDKEQEFAMDIFWQPGNDNNAPIQYYTIQYDTKWGDKHWQFQANETAVASTETYRKVLHLQPFVEYRFRIIAVNEIGESQPSVEVAPTVAPQAAPPSNNPYGVSGSGTRPESMVIRWMALHPFYYSGDDFHYEVAYRPRGSSEPFIRERVDPENTDSNPNGVTQNFTVNARKPYEEFEFSVRSVNDAGPGPYPDIFFGFSGEDAPSAAPTSVMVEAISANEVNVIWDPISEEDANGPLGGYNVYYNLRIGSGTDKETCVQSPCIVGNLQAATTYEIQVVAFTNAGEGPRSGTLTVLTDSADDIPPSIVVQPQPVYGDDRLPMILTCQATGRPEPMYYWEKNGVLVDVANNPSASLDGGNLVINPLTKEDNGQYQCFAYNRLGTAISKKVNTTVAFMEQFEYTLPTTNNVRQGEPLKLLCGVNYGPPRGYPSPVIYWTEKAWNSQRSTRITYNKRFNQDQDGNLVFSNVNASDAKRYYCLAINKVLGVSQRSPKIIVQVLTDLPPVMSGAALVAKPAANEVAIRTETLKLKCIAIGYPTPTITWKRGEEQLQSGGRVSIDESGQELVISAVKNSDNGSYTCNAENSEGTDEFTTVVTVESAPYFPAAPSDETKGPGESVSIECRAEGVPPPTVDWLVNGQPWADIQSNIDTARWTVVSGGSKVATIDITNLQTTDSNVFQCIATNKYSEEITNVVLNVVSPPGSHQCSC